MDLITTIIVVKDNPPHLSETIDSVYSFSSEIFIVDIGINIMLKKQLSNKDKVTIIEIKEKVPYVELIREKVKLLAKSEYVLFLDPDETLNPKLITLLESSIGIYDYVKMPRKNIIFGKWIEHSRWWPDYQIRFFKKQQVIWPTEIHKQPSVTGKGLTIEPKEENAIIHYNYESLDEYMQKALRYAKSEANMYINNNVNITLKETVRLSISEFISRFFAHDGYKDGLHGFVLSFLQMFYSFLVYFYWWEMKKYPQDKSEITTEVSKGYFQQGMIETQHWMDVKKLQKKSIKEKIISKLL